MAEQTERVTQVTDNTAPVAAPVTQTARTTEVSNTKLTGGSLAARIVQFITSAILVLLAIRFVFVLLGANAANGFANAIYEISRPFVAPFFGLFGYDLSYGVSKFETYTLVAMAIYAIVGYGIARLMTIRQPRSEV